MTTPRDVTKLTGADLFAALISDVPIVVDNRKHKKTASTAGRKAKSKANGSGLHFDGPSTQSELEILTERQRLQQIIRGMSDREYKPIAIVLMVQDTICLTCGTRHVAPFCEVPMLKLRRKRRDDSKATIYARLDHRIPAIHSNLPRYIQRQERFTYSCHRCFEITQKPKRHPYPY